MRAHVLRIALFCLVSAPVHAQSLSIRGIPGGGVIVAAQDIEKMNPIEITDAREIGSGGGKERLEVAYRGIELGRLLTKTGFDKLDRRAVRTATITVTARDGYQAKFSWGEVFNSLSGQRILLITSERGPATNPNEGAFSLRALSDLRQGPRHVRDVTEIAVEVPR